MANHPQERPALRHCPAILTASILGIARVAGETAPIMFTAAYALRDEMPWQVQRWTDFFFQGVMALPYHIYVVSSKIPQNEYTERVQYGAAFVFLRPRDADCADLGRLARTQSEPFIMVNLIDMPESTSTTVAGRIGPAPPQSEERQTNDRRPRSELSPTATTRCCMKSACKFRARAVTAFIGPSGCGKTTLLRCFNRMNDLVDGARITRGSIVIEGRDINAPTVDVVDLRRRIGMVFQKSNPFPKSIYDNIAYGLRIAGVTKRSKINEAVEKSLRAAALWDEVKDRLERSAYGLSGGQQQRLCIARALAVEPEIVLMDEPCSALDPIATAKVEELIRTLKTDYTIVIVTHNMQQAGRCSDHTAFFYLGRLIEFGDTPRIFSQSRATANRGLHYRSVRLRKGTAMTPPKHILGTFDEALATLRNNVLMMASLTARSLDNALNGLLQRDDDLCATAIVDDEEIDQLEKQVDKDGIDLFLRFQPVASDLRRVVSAMKLSSNLERMGDQAVSIARKARKLNRHPHLPETELIEPMREVRDADVQGQRRCVCARGR